MIQSLTCKISNTTLPCRPLHHTFFLTCWRLRKIYPVIIFFVPRYEILMYNVIKICRHTVPPFVKINHVVHQNLIKWYTKYYNCRINFSQPLEGYKNLMCSPWRVDVSGHLLLGNLAGLLGDLAGAFLTGMK